MPDAAEGMAALIARLRQGEPDRYPDAWRAADIMEAAAQYVAAWHRYTQVALNGKRRMVGANALRAEQNAWARLVALVAPAKGEG